MASLKSGICTFLFYLTAVAEEGYHNPLEEWANLFSSFDRFGEGHGRRLGTATSIEFSAAQIAHRGEVQVLIESEDLADDPNCNLTYVALYSPADANINATTPVRYQSLLYLSPNFCNPPPPTTAAPTKASKAPTKKSPTTSAPSTVTVAPSTVTVAPSTTTVAPSTSAPTTTTLAPTASTLAPTTSTPTTSSPSSSSTAAPSSAPSSSAPSASNAASSAASSKTAKFSFRLHNLRGGYKAYLVQGGVSLTKVQTMQTTFLVSGAKPWVDLAGMKPTVGLRGTVLAVSSPLTFFEPNEPTHVRVTTGANPGNFRISWNHDENSTGGELRWTNSSTTPRNLWQLAAPAVNWTNTINDVCAMGPAASSGFRSFGVQYTANLDLVNHSGKVIYYAVGDASGLSNKTFTLNVPLMPGQPSRTPQEWVVIADNGVGYYDDSYTGRNYNNGVFSGQITQAVAWEASLRRLAGVIVNGDISYADGYLAQMEDYMDLTESYASLTPFLTAVGNHESDWYRNNNGIRYDSPDNSTPTSDYWATDSKPDNSISSGGECGLAMKVWPQASATPVRPWYSYASGLMTVVFFSTEHNFTEGSEQWEWLNDTLSSVNHSLTPWLVVVGHRPMYLSYTNPDPNWGGIMMVAEMMRQQLEPLWIQHGVSLMLTGHVHNTQRSCAASKGHCSSFAEKGSDGFHEYIEPRDPVYYVLGCGGANIDAIGTDISEVMSYGSSNIAYALMTVQSADVLEVVLKDPRTNSTLDKARIMRNVTNSGGKKDDGIYYLIAAGVLLLLIGLFVAIRLSCRHRFKKHSILQRVDTISYEAV